MKLGRPVKWIESRRESLMSANHAREVELRGRDRLRRATAASSGMRAVMRADIGAYVRTAALVPAEFGAALLPGPYRVPNYALRSLVGRHQQDAGRHAALARAPRVQLRPRAADGRGRRPARPRSRRDPPAQPDPRGRDAVRLRHQVVRRQHGLRLRRLPRALRRAAAPPRLRPRARAEQAAHERAARVRGAASGSPSTSRRPASGRSRPTQVEARADGTLHRRHRRVLDGPGARDRARPDPRRGARACPPTRFDVRHADTAAVESGVGTYGSRGTVTAGNAAQHGRGQAHRRGAVARRGAPGACPRPR